jgi:hypothetical protein
MGDKICIHGPLFLNGTGDTECSMGLPPVAESAGQRLFDIGVLLQLAMWALLSLVY